MIELTARQRKELTPPESLVVDPGTQETYVLVRKEVFDRLKELAGDASPWTADEMDFLAEEAGELLDRYQP